MFSQALRDNTHLYVRKSQSQTNISEQLHPEPQDPGQAQDAGTHTYTHTPGSMTARRPTHITDTHVTHIHTGLSERSRGARTHANARPQPYPDHPSFPNTTYQGCRACSRCVAVSEPFNLTGTTHKFIDTPWVCTQSPTQEADISSAIVSAGKGPQENLDRESEIRTWGVAGNDGGAELLAGSSGRGCRQPRHGG